MATEDHDFEEINYFNFKGKIQMEQGKHRTCGRLSQGLSDVFELYSQELVQAPMPLKTYLKMPI
jgi:hypothetical protein